MSGGFVVSVRAGGIAPPVERQSQVVVAGGFPNCPHCGVAAETGDLHIVFASDRVLQIHDQSTISASAEPPCALACGCIRSRETLVVHGDAGSCASGSHEAWGDVLSSLKDIGEAFCSRAADARREWVEARSSPQPSLRTDGPAPTARSGPSGGYDVFNGSLQGGHDCARRLDGIGPSRAAYARELSKALSRHCRWRCPAASHSGGSGWTDCPIRCGRNFHLIMHPSAAFSLVFHSQAFGILAFCRDKLGLASLLAAGPSYHGEEGTYFALTTSKARLQVDRRHGNDEKALRERIIEVPVDGVWLIDLWELADSVRYQDAATVGIPASTAPAEGSETGDAPEVAPFCMRSAFCIPWKHPSIIRGEHVWCSCGSCAKSRAAFWQQHASSACSLYGLDCSLTGATELRRALPVVSFPVSGATTVSPTPNGSGCTELNDGFPLASTQVLSCLYSQICSAVARALPEALRRIQCKRASLVGCEAADPVFVGVLFSGGLDSTLLAGIVLRSLAAAMVRISDVHAAGCKIAKYAGSEKLATERGASPLRLHESVFSFGCEYSCATAQAERCDGGPTDSQPKAATALQRTVVVELVSVSFSAEAPDRLTALRSFEELLRLLRSLGKPSNPCGMPDAGEAPYSCSSAVIGEWILELRLVAIDVSSDDSAECRNQLLAAIHPKISHMDLNIASPLYFASR